MNTEQLKTKEQILDKAVYGNLNYVPIHKIKTLILEVMSDFAVQESNKVVDDFKYKLKGEIERVRDLSVGDPAITSAYDNCIKLIDLIDKL